MPGANGKTKKFAAAMQFLAFESGMRKGAGLFGRCRKAFPDPVPEQTGGLPDAAGK
jgi:hypothetical protein